MEGAERAEMFERDEQEGSPDGETVSNDRKNQGTKDSRGFIRPFEETP